MWPSATPAVRGLVPGKAVLPKVHCLCPLHTAPEALHAQSCTVQGRDGPVPSQMSFSPCQGGSGKCLQGLWWKDGCSWPSAVSPAVLQGAATSVNTLGRFHQAREGQWVDKELSVMPRAPLLSHDGGGSMASVAAIHVGVCTGKAALG